MEEPTALTFNHTKELRIFFFLTSKYYYYYPHLLSHGLQVQIFRPCKFRA